VNHLDSGCRYKIKVIEMKNRSFEHKMSIGKSLIKNSAIDLKKPAEKELPK
jgi:hypothetical protein